MQYDFEVVFAKNNHQFVDEYLKKPEFVELMRRLGALGDNQDKSEFYAFAGSLSLSLSVVTFNSVIKRNKRTFIVFRVHIPVFCMSLQCNTDL